MFFARIAASHPTSLAIQCDRKAIRASAFFRTGFLMNKEPS
jgi:hypothetical protein